MKKLKRKKVKGHSGHSGLMIYVRVAFRGNRLKTYAFERGGFRVVRAQSGK